MSMRLSPGNDEGGGEILETVGKGDLAEVVALLQRNHDLVSSKDNQGDAPLHFAASHGYKGVTELLLDNKADVNAKVDGGWTALHYAAAGGHADLAKLLRENGGRG